MLSISHILTNFLFFSLSKDSKNNARKNKRNLKTNRYDLSISEPFDKIHKKQKLNPEKELEEPLISEDLPISIHDEKGIKTIKNQVFFNFFK